MTATYFCPLRHVSSEIHSSFQEGNLRTQGRPWCSKHADRHRPLRTGHGMMTVATAGTSPHQPLTCDLWHVGHRQPLDAVAAAPEGLCDLAGQEVQTSVLLLQGFGEPVGLARQEPVSVT